MSYKESSALNDFFYGLDVKKLPDQFQELIDIMGLEDAYIFSKLFGGLSIDVPHAKNIDRQLRNREIINLLDRGKSRTEVAKIYNLGVRQVANIKKTVCK